MKLTETTGLVIREVKYGDSSRIVTVITEELGKISAITGKYRGGKSKAFPSIQLFSYNRFVLFRGSEKGLYHINETDIIESFGNIREDLMGIIYASYFGDVANKVAVENESDTDFLRLLLNIFYALSKGNDYEKIKTVFEWKTAVLEGYAPNLEKCAVCGAEAIAYLDIARGCSLCPKCGKDYAGAAQLNQSLVSAIKYITEADFSKMLAFDMPNPMIEYMNSLSEIYLEMHLEAKFKTLDYLKKMKI